MMMDSLKIYTTDDVTPTDVGTGARRYYTLYLYEKYHGGDDE